MKKRVLRKSEVLKEGYLNGLRKAQRIINEMLTQSQGFDNDFDEFETSSASGINSASKENNSVYSDIQEELVDAVYDDDWKKVKRLISKGADITEMNSDWGDDSALHVAASQGRTDVCEWLIKLGMEVNAQRMEGETPLHLAAGWKRPETCQLLINHGAEVNVENRKGETPLQFAEGDTPEAIKTRKILLMNGAK